MPGSKWQKGKIMAINKKFKKVKNKNFKKRKKYSYLDRMSYYEKKAYSGKTIREQDYAYGYLDGMRGIIGRNETASEKAGNDAGLRFWSRLTKTEL